MEDADLSRDGEGLPDRAGRSNRQDGQDSDSRRRGLVEPVPQLTDITALAVRMGSDVRLVNQQGRLAKHQQENRQPV